MRPLTELTADQRAKHDADVKKHMEEREKQLALLQKDAVKRAKWRWGHSLEATGHAYLEQKGIEPHHARVSGTALCIPLYDETRELVNVQSIYPNGEKRNVKGAKYCQVYSPFGESKDAKTILIGEGFSTTASAHEATKAPAYMAVTADNMPWTAEHVRKLHPDANIIILGDNDEKGVKAANLAAKACGGRAVFPAFPEGTDPSKNDFNDMAALCGLDAVRDCIEAAEFVAAAEAKGDGPTSRDAIRQKYIFHGDQVPDPPPGIIKGMLPRTGTGLIIGQSGAGKTFLTIDLGFAVASGGQFFGKDIRTRVGVVFIAAEPGMFHQRIEACIKHRGIEGNIPFAYLPFSGDLNNDDEFKLLLAELSVVDATFREDHGIELGMVVLDTMSKAFAMKNQNEAGEVNAVLKRVDQISRRANVFSLGVHHLGKDVDRGAAGSYAFEAGVDVLMSAIASGPEGGRIRGIVDRREFCLTKYRDGRPGPIADYDLVEIDLGVDGDGHPKVSLAVTPKDTATDKTGQRKKSPTKAEKVFAEAFDGCAQNCPIEHGDETGNVVTAVDADRFKTAFIWSYGGNPSSAERQRKRAWDKLVAAGAYATEQTPTRLLIWRVLQ